MSRGSENGYSTIMLTDCMKFVFEAVPFQMMRDNICVSKETLVYLTEVKKGMLAIRQR